jgi:glutaryl-CoA dehydrogenase
MTLATDYLGLDALLSAGELAWRDTVRAFVRDRIRPNITAWYESAVFPAEIVPEMGRLGLLGAHLSGYGCPGRSAVEYGLAALELEAGDSGLRTFVSVQGSLAMSAIHKFGTEAHKERCRNWPCAPRSSVTSRSPASGCPRTRSCPGPRACAARSPA